MVVANEGKNKENDDTIIDGDVYGLNVKKQFS